MFKSKERQGEAFIISEAFLWGLFPVITLLAYKNISPIVTYAWSSFFAVLTFAIIITVRKKWGEIKDKAAIIDILKATFFIGFLFYGFFFWGLMYTSAGNAALLSLAEVFFTFVFFNVFKKEYVPRNHVLGAVLMVLGAVIVVYPNFSHFQLGDLLLILATMFAPLGNFYQQRARKRVSSEMIMFVRDIFVAVFAFAAIFLLDLNGSFSNIQDSFWFLVINGALLFGFSKIFWVEGVHRISITKAISLGSIYPFFTILFAWLFLKDLPTIWQLGASVPLFVGVLLLSQKNLANKIVEIKD